MRNIRYMVMALGLLGGVEARAELITTIPGTHWTWSGNYVTGQALYSACTGLMSRIGQSTQYCGASAPVVAPGSAAHIFGGWFRDLTIPPSDTNSNFKFYYLNAYACENSQTIRYFSDVRKCVGIVKISSPLPTNAKANGAACPRTPQDRQPTCGNPITIGTGNKVQQEIDYAAKTPALPLDLTRTYNGGVFSGDVSARGAFGSRWTHAIDRKVTLHQNQVPMECYRRTDNNTVFCMLDSTPGSGQAAFVTRADGKVYQFKRAGTQWIAEADVDDRLSAELDADGITPLSWTYSTASHDTERYDAVGRLLSVTSRNGQTQQYTYSTGMTNDTSAARWPETAPACANVQAGAPVATGLAICVTDPSGRQLQFEYDDQGRVTKAIDPANQSYLYEYDGASGGCLATAPGSPACTANNLTGVTFPDGKKRTYHYNEDSLINGGDCYGMIKFSTGFGHLGSALTGITDENGVRYASWGWDCQGLAVSSQHAGGVDKVTVAHGPRAADGSNTVTVTSHMGTASAPVTMARNYHFKLSLGVARNDALDQPCEGCEGMQERTYDAANNVSSSKDWTGAKTIYTYDTARNLETSRTEAHGTALARTISTAWHPTMRLRSQVAEPLRMTSYTYDANGNLLSKTVQATSDANGSLGFTAPAVGTARTWNYTYGTKGQLLTATGPGVSESMSYDNDGNLETVTNALGHVTSYSGYDVHGRVGVITDPNGLASTFSYGPRGWLDSTSVGGEVTSYSYDGVGQLKSVTLPDGARIDYSYDNAHRLIGIMDSLGNKVSYTLDLVGNRIEEQTKDANGVLTRKITRVYDTLKRLKQITGAQQ